jgi:hypothetical protein
MKILPTLLKGVAALTVSTTTLHATTFFVHPVALPGRPVSVPESGATFLLLAIALVAIAVVRRKLAR